MKRSSDTEAAIRAVLDEEDAKKRAKKSGTYGVGKKGLSLAELEEQEGGVVKESLVGMAQTKRAGRRKARKAVDDTELVQDVEAVEENLAVEEDDGIQIEPFNLKAERQEGYFDESGHYVENKAADEDAAADAWLETEGGALVSDAVRLQVEKRQREEAEAEAAPPITGVQLAGLQRDICVLLEEGETVTKALRRLGAFVKQKSLAGEADVLTTQKEAKEKIEKLTEAASQLMNSGELDVYDMTKREFEVAAALYAPPQREVAAVEDDDDMFGDDFKEETAGHSGAAKQSAGAAMPTETAQPATLDGNEGTISAPRPVFLTSPSDPVDYSSWPVKELRRFLQERGQVSSDIVEKPELVAAVQEAAKQGTEGELAQAPLGYVYDPSSGYHYSDVAGLYWDAASNAFYSATNAKWFTYNQQEEKYVEFQSQQ